MGLFSGLSMPFCGRFSLRDFSKQFRGLVLRSLVRAFRTNAVAVVVVAVVVEPVDVVVPCLNALRKFP